MAQNYVNANPHKRFQHHLYNNNLEVDFLIRTPLFSWAQSKRGVRTKEREYRTEKDRKDGLVLSLVNRGILFLSLYYSRVSRLLVAAAYIKVPLAKDCDL